MKREFKLEKVLDFKVKNLDREKIKLRELVNQERKMLMQMAEISEEIGQKRAEQEADIAKGDFDFASLYNKYIALREDDFRAIERERGEVLKSIEKQREVLKKALNDVKIMEKLKEKHLIEYTKYLQKQEEKQNDEVNITRRTGE